MSKERELEVKLLGLDLEELEQKIREAGGEFLGAEHQTNWTINRSDVPYPEEKGYLRIRRTKKQGLTSCEVTLKEKKEASEVREHMEHTVAIDDAEEMLLIFQTLGYDEIHRGEKHRKSYRLEGARIDLDAWDEKTYPYPYAEVEVKREEDLGKILELLQVPEEAVSLLSISDLRRQWKKDVKNNATH